MFLWILLFYLSSIWFVLLCCNKLLKQILEIMRLNWIWEQVCVWESFTGEFRPTLAETGVCCGGRSGCEQPFCQPDQPLGHGLCLLFLWYHHHHHRWAAALKPVSLRLSELHQTCKHHRTCYYNTFLTISVCLFVSFVLQALVTCPLERGLDSCSACVMPSSASPCLASCWLEWVTTWARCCGELWPRLRPSFWWEWSVLCRNET